MHVHHKERGLAWQKTSRHAAWGIAEVVLADDFSPLCVRYPPFKVVNLPADHMQLAPPFTYDISIVEICSSDAKEESHMESNTAPSLSSFGTRAS